MPEYLAPGVYVEEVSFRAKSIEGVSTSIAGFIGPARYGPVGGEPELLTSFADYTRIYGGIDSLTFGSRKETIGGREQITGGQEQINFLAHAVRAFFDNGGSKLYVTRVYDPTDPNDPMDGKSHCQLSAGSPCPIDLHARFPGGGGNMRIVFAVKAGPNLVVPDPNNLQKGRMPSLRENEVVYLREKAPGSPARAGFYDVERDAATNLLQLRQAGTGTLLKEGDDLVPNQDFVHVITITVRVLRAGQFEIEENLGDFSPHPKPAKNRTALTDYFIEKPESRSFLLTIPFAINTNLTSGAEIANLLLTGTGRPVVASLNDSLIPQSERTTTSPPRPRPEDLECAYVLRLGYDGILPRPEPYRGREVLLEKTGLLTFEDIDEISMVAAPGYSVDYTLNEARADSIANLLITHCEDMRYRVAILDSPNKQILSEVRDVRAKFDSTRAAFYYPWITLLDPLDPDGRREIDLPPSGFVAGIYARNDVEKGVFKTPANEVVRGAIGLELLLNKAQQDILNPLGINCFRFFPGRGFRLWGGRTISSDPEWKYVSVRRYFAYLEHSIDRGTQWAVFEVNGPRLWTNVRRTVEDYLFNEWKSGALLGAKPEEAFFVRCDLSTMNQNDLDNGRLVCLIGVAVAKPAEFVIFRIGQMTLGTRV